MTDYPKPPFPKQAQPVPGSQRKMEPYPDCGEQSYVGSGRLAGKIALITGADSGIGRAVAIAFAREGADVAVAYLNEHEDAKETARWVEQAGRQCILLPGDIAEKAQCRCAGRQDRRALWPHRHSGQQRRVPDDPRKLRRNPR